MQLSTNDDATVPAATRDAWSVTCDALLSGLAHALSNRVASLNAVVSMPAEGAAAAGLSLDTEVMRLNELLRLLRALAVRPAGRAVALDGAVMLAQAAELHATHPALRDVPVRVEAGEPPPPILVPEGALTRALLLAFTGARSAAAAARLPGVVARCHGADERVLFQVEPVALGDVPLRTADAFAYGVAAPLGAEAQAALALLAPSGGEVREEPAGRYRISVPAVRRRVQAPR